MDKKNYTTSEAAHALNLAPSTLRYWESELGNILNIPRNENGYRQYTADNIETLKKIKKYLYDQKYSIKQVREIMNLEESKQELAASLVGTSDTKLNSLVTALLDKLDDVENGIDELKDGQKNLKHEYLQAVKLLNITSERRDRELIKEIRKRMDEKKVKNSSGFLQKLLPWGKDDE